MLAGQCWDIFCTVIDNYGDIGVTWRLARQLADEYGIRVRLWVDDLDSFHRLRPDIDPALACQQCQGVEIRLWREPLPPAEPGQVVIEALACNLPASFVAAMAAKPNAPVWINLEYLSAEDWVAGCHALPSPHPRLPLVKHFFMPGYGPGTGGVLKESWLPGRRDAFQADPTARAGFWRRLGVPPQAPDEMRASLFCYESPAIASLFEAWAGGSRPHRCLVPEGKALADVARFFGSVTLSAGATVSQGSLTVHILPMLELDDYDRLLWACDCNFVRGEDSFVRALWSGKPLVWQAYRQEEGAHWAKIEAFLARYCAGLAADDEAALRQVWQLWNADGEVGPAWSGFWARAKLWRRHSAWWQARMDEVGDLAGNLVEFCSQKFT